MTERRSTTGWRPTVWAPRASCATLVQATPDGGRRMIPMQARHDGWWQAADRLPSGSHYAFSIDDGDARPDPRSAWQPDGVHGMSRVFDATGHDWRDAEWPGRDVRGAVIMEVHVGTFTEAGTLDAAIERLDHLVDLGVDMVELMPVAAFAGQHGWGYDGVALYAVHEPYGGPAALQRFVDAAHARGLAVCLDVVYNHLGPSGNYLDTFGPYFTDRHHTPWGQAINLDDDGATEVRAWIIDNACRWYDEFHVDALRLDAVHALVDDSETHLLAELSDRVRALSTRLRRPLSLIAESDLNDSRMIEPVDSGGLGMTAQWADDVHHAIHATMTGERQGYYGDFGGLDVLAKALTRVFVHDGGYSTFRERDWGRPVPPGTDGHRFVVFASDHDQVGNRAVGDRPSARLDDDALAIEAALVLTSAFTPMLFMGEEWGARTPWQFFTDHQEPELADAIRQGRAREFGGHGWTELYGGDVTIPDPQDPATFAASRLDWSELETSRSQRLFDWYRTLIRLRREQPDLHSGDLESVSVRYAEDGTWIVVARGDVRIVMVLADQPTTVKAGEPSGRIVLASWGCEDAVFDSDDGLELPGRSVSILRIG